MAPNIDINTLNQGETAVINGKNVTKINTLYFEIDGQLVSRERLNDFFGRNDDVGNTVLDKKIALYDAMIAECEDQIAYFDVEHGKSKKDISIFRREKHSILAHAGVSDPNKLEKDKRKDYDEFNTSQYNATSHMHMATNKICQFAHAAVGLILHRGDLQSQQIISKNYSNYA